MRISFTTLPALVLTNALAVAAETVDFNKDIRPILSEKCYHCHGPDEGSRKAKMRLDVRAEALKDRDGFRAIVPGDPVASEMIVRVLSTDPEEVMPPPKEQHALTPTEIAKLKSWIAQGAEYAPHWAWEAPTKRDVAGTENATPETKIDAFISAALGKAGLTLSPEADKPTLLRRVSLDLIGLPPTYEETVAFVADKSPEAYAKAVDRLLASPAYGERWAKLWLDLARYADSTGYGSDKFRLNIWPWRDWVIDAFNRNQSYDQFTIEQLAGDLLPNATAAQIQATAFHRNTMTNVEGGTDDEEYRVAAVKDRVATTMQVWMGLTAQCAQCHTHKFDPITHHEYYSLFAVFNQTEDADREDEKPRLPLPTPAETAEQERLQREITRLDAALKSESPELDAEQHAWEAEMARPAEWTTLGEGSGKLVVSNDAARSFTALRVEARDGMAPNDLQISVAPGPAVPGQPLRARKVRVTLPGTKALLALAEVEVFSGGENVAVKGQATQSSTDFGGEAKRGNDGKTDGDYFKSNSVTHTRTEDNPWWEVDLGSALAIERLVIWNRTDGDTGRRLANFRVSITDDAGTEVFAANFAEPPKPTLALDPRDGSPLVVRRSSAAGSAAVFEVTPPLAAVAGDGPVRLTVALRPATDPAAPGRAFVLAATKQVPPPRELPETIKRILAIEPSERDAAQRAEIAAYFRPLSATIARLETERSARQAELALIKPVELPVLRELAADQRRKTWVLNKGNFMMRGAEVGPALLASFHPAPTNEINRLALAQWLVSRENPLTARVTVNRFWAQIFGTGLVESEEDFGTQGQLPSHPELLDWLAVDFMERGWDVKALLRQIVLSATYRQAANVSVAAAQKDPRNLLLSHFPRRRLDAETVRDQALQVAGLLSRKRGGPSVYPPQPPGMWNVAFNEGQTNYPTSTGEDRYRRGIYTFWRRTMPNPTMTTFDAPSRETCTLRRGPTNTPLQAFVTLNDPVFVEAAQALARRILKDACDCEPDERLSYAVELVTARPASETQLGTLRKLHDHALALYRSDLPAATKLATGSLGPLPPEIDPAEAAAWTVVANVLLNLDTVLTKG